MHDKLCVKVWVLRNNRWHRRWWIFLVHPHRNLLLIPFLLQRSWLVLSSRLFWRGHFFGCFWVYPCCFFFRWTLGTDLLSHFQNGLGVYLVQVHIAGLDVSRVVEGHSCRLLTSRCTTQNLCLFLWGYQSSFGFLVRVNRIFWLAGNRDDLEDYRYQQGERFRDAVAIL